MTKLNTALQSLKQAMDDHRKTLACFHKELEEEMITVIKGLTSIVEDLNQRRSKP